MTETPDLTIATLLSSYRAGKTTPREIVRAAFEKADQSDAAIWISRPDWSVVDGMLAALEKRDPSSLPLYGIPFAIKDNIDWDALPTTSACPAYSYQPAKSAFVVEQLIAAGAIPLGKTNLDQFATGLVGVRSPYGIPQNAFDAEYIPGGSSSGSAVAVALGMASFSLGTDTAGSGRVPASFNNLVGWKPTRGLLSTSGLVPACRTLDCISVFALTVGDASTVAEVVAKFDSSDAYARPYVASQRPWDPASVVLGVPREDQRDFFGDADAKKLYEESIARAQSLGWRVREIDLQPFLDAARLLYEGPWVAERYAVIPDLIEKNPEALHPITLQIIEGGAKPNAVAAFTSQYRLAELKRASEAVWSDVDAILTPTAGTIYKVAEVLADPIKLNSNLGKYTNYMNLLDLSAWAVPAGFLGNGLPWGVTLFAPAFEDRRLSVLASALHAASNLPLGKTSISSSGLTPITPANEAGSKSWMQIAVCGAHMKGLPLNHQLTSRGGRLVRKGTTTPDYRLYRVPGSGSIPDRPGLVRVTEGGTAIALEVWELPEDTVGSFVNAVPPPLGFGKVQLEDGSKVFGFLCESIALQPEEEITSFGGWRAWMQSRSS
ncbi:MAG: allophanate hydrolase [Roseimicrobium sp.]